MKGFKRCRDLQVSGGDHAPGQKKTFHDYICIFYFYFLDKTLHILEGLLSGASEKTLTLSFGDQIPKTLFIPGVNIRPGGSDSNWTAPSPGVNGVRGVSKMHCDPITQTIFRGGLGCFRPCVNM